MPAGDDFDGWVALLGRRQLRQRARRHLMAVGGPALPALRRGLRSPIATVRAGCASILDHLVDDESVPALVAALDDPDGAVLARALHALACDRCKQGACRPSDDLFVPKALELVRSHPDPDVRASAIDALAKAAERNPDVAVALTDAAAGEHHPGLRHLAERKLAQARAQPRAEAQAARRYRRTARGTNTTTSATIQSRA
jgi:HEAT repeat protein